MIADAVLIQRPAIDFGTFLSLGTKALGYSPASAADASRRPLGDAERFLSCLAAMRDQKAPATLAPHLLGHVYFSVLIAAEEQDLLDILQVASGMSFVTTDTVVRHIHLALISGTLNQWRDAVKGGTTADVTLNVRGCFGKIMGLFEREGLSGVWNDFTKKPLDDRTFLLEDKRK